MIEINTDEVPPAAEALRMSVLQQEWRRRRLSGRHGRCKLAAFTRDFMQDHVGRAGMVRRLVMTAVEGGKFEAMVIQLPLATPKRRRTRDQQQRSALA